MRNWLRTHWIGAAVLLALIASPIYSHQDAKYQARHQSNANRVAQVNRCISAAPRAAYDIAFQYQAGEARKASGNIVTADRYNALADAGILTVAAPKGFEGRKDLVEVVYVKGQGGGLVARLTPDARALQRAGCIEAYR